jgi:hypothetical protein
MTSTSPGRLGATAVGQQRPWAVRSAGPAVAPIAGCTAREEECRIARLHMQISVRPLLRRSFAEQAGTARSLPVEVIVPTG